MADKVMQLLAEETGGRSYKAHKYGLDHAERPVIDYSEDGAVWEKMAETSRNLPVIQRSGIKINSVIPYDTSGSKSDKFEDRGTARIQDRMVQCEKDMVTELVCITEHL